MTGACQFRDPKPGYCSSGSRDAIPGAEGSACACARTRGTAFADSDFQDGMALALDGYAALAARYEAGLTRIDGFDVGLIEEARTLGVTLREQSAAALVRTTPDAQRQALALRNQLLTLLTERVRRVRRAAQYVFRNFPEVTRKFTSAYERRQRSARRRTKELEAEATAANENGAVASAE